MPAYQQVRRIKHAVQTCFFAAFTYGAAIAPCCANDQKSDFETWKNAFFIQAQKSGIHHNTLVAAFDKLEPNPKIIELDRNQPEFLRTYAQYIQSAVTHNRVTKARKLLQQHRKLFKRVEKKYGVPAPYLLAFWGIETNFGNNKGSLPVIRSLATLSYDTRRREFFTTELIHALKILQQGHIKLTDMKGSWAGAMGHFQFIPTTFTSYAVDANTDGRIDVIDQFEDALESAANYLSSIGWDKEYIWGRAVQAPWDFDWKHTNSATSLKLEEWRKLGITKENGKPLPKADISARLLAPAGYRGPVFLVYDNFELILKWNRSDLYALAVGQLADAIDGKGLPSFGVEKLFRPLLFNEIKELQEQLTLKGFGPVAVDGVAGSETREAVRRFQNAINYPVDGIVSRPVYARLKRFDPSKKSGLVPLPTKRRLKIPPIPCRKPQKPLMSK